MTFDSGARKRAQRAKKIALLAQTNAGNNSIDIDSMGVDPRTLGAKADVWCYNDGTISAGSLNVITLGTKAWQATATTTGNPIVVRGAGVSGADLITTIVSASGNSITLASPAAAAMTNASGLFGSDDAPAINAALAANGFNGIWSTGASDGPTVPRNTGNGAWWAHGPKFIRLRSKGRNNSLFGILSPIILKAGSNIHFETPVYALPGFPAGQAMLTQYQPTTADIAFNKIKEPTLIADGFADYGMWLEKGGTVEIIGQTKVLGANITGVQIGAPVATGGQYDRMIVATFTGRVLIQNTAGPGGYKANNPNSIGFYFGNQAYDNTVNGDIHVLGYNTGYRDDGGNNKVHGTVHCWTGLNVGYMTNAIVLNGGNFHLDRAYIDSPCAASGTTTYGVTIGSYGRIDEVASTVNPSVGTLDNQHVLVQNNYSGTLGASIGSIHSVSTSGIKFKSIVAGTTTNLTIGSIGSDGNYYSVGYALEPAVRAAQDTALQNQITSISSTLPASASNVGWNAEFSVICRSTGSSGTVVGIGSVTHDSGTSRGGASLNGPGGLSSLNTTQANAFSVTATWATANASNSISNIIAEILAIN